MAETDINKYIGRSFQSGTSLIYIFHISRQRRDRDRGTTVSGRAMPDPYKYKIFYFHKKNSYIASDFMSDSRFRKLKKTDANLRREAYERIFNHVFGVAPGDRTIESESFHFKEMMSAWERGK